MATAAIRSVLSSSGAGANSSANVAVIFDMPTTVAGDLMLAYVDTRSNGAYTSNSTKQGWTWIGRSNRGTAGYEQVYMKYASSSEPATYNFGLVDSGTNYNWLATVICFVGAATVDTFAGASNASSTSMQTPSVVTTEPNQLLLRAVYSAVGSTTPQTYSWPAPSTALANAYVGRVDGAGGSSHSHGIATEVGPSAPGASGSRTATASATQTYGSSTLSILSPPAPTASVLSGVASMVTSAPANLFYITAIVPTANTLTGGASSAFSAQSALVVRQRYLLPAGGGAQFSTAVIPKARLNYRLSGGSVQFSAFDTLVFQRAISKPHLRNAIRAVSISEDRRTQPSPYKKVANSRVINVTRHTSGGR